MAKRVSAEFDDEAFRRAKEKKEELDISWKEVILRGLETRPEPRDIRPGVRVAKKLLGEGMFDQPAGRGIRAEVEDVEASDDAVLALPGTSQEIPVKIRLRTSRDGMEAPFVEVRDQPGMNQLTEEDRQSVMENLSDENPAVLKIREAGRGEYEVFPIIDWSRDDAGNIVAKDVEIEDFVEQKTE